MFENRFMSAVFGNGDYIEETTAIFPFGAVPLPQPKYHKPQKTYREVEVAPWYGKAKNMQRAVNDYLAKQLQRHFEIVKKDFDFNGRITIVTKNKKSRVKETKKFYAR